MLCTCSLSLTCSHYLVNKYFWSLSPTCSPQYLVNKYFRDSDGMVSVIGLYQQPSPTTDSWGEPEETASLQWLKLFLLQHLFLQKHMYRLHVCCVVTPPSSLNHFISIGTKDSGQSTIKSFPLCLRTSIHSLGYSPNQALLIPMNKRQHSSKLTTRLPSTGLWKQNSQLIGDNAIFINANELLI